MQIQGLQLLTSWSNLTLSFWCVLTTCLHSCELASFYAWCTQSNHANAYAYLWLWTHSHCLGQSHGLYKQLSFLYLWLSTDNGWIYVLQVHNCHLIMFTMSTSKPHFLVLTPILEYPYCKEWWGYQLIVLIFGNHLVLLFCSNQLEISGYYGFAIWNWHTGGPTSSAFSSCHIYNAPPLTPPRQCTQKMRL